MKIGGVESALVEPFKGDACKSSSVAKIAPDSNWPGSLLDDSRRVWLGHKADDEEVGIGHHRWITELTLALLNFFDEKAAYRMAFEEICKLKVW